MLSQVYFTIRLKVRRQETAIRPRGHLGQLHLLAILNSYRHQLYLVMEPPPQKKNSKRHKQKITLTVLLALHLMFGKSTLKKTIFYVRN